MYTHIYTYIHIYIYIYPCMRIQIMRVCDTVGGFFCVNNGSEGGDNREHSLRNRICRRQRTGPPSSLSIYIYIHIHTYVCLCVCIYILNIYMHYNNVRKHMHTYICTCIIYTCMYYMYMYIHIYTCIQYTCTDR
jgi:hypothetical protein